jgi:outer membrane protein TolC
VALARYRSGAVPQTDVLKAQIELEKLDIELAMNRQEELSAKAELMAILNRPPADTIGYAAVSEEVIFSASLDSLEALAVSQRPMLVHDSLSIAELDAERSLAGQEYLPDFRLGLQYVTSPTTDFTGWGISAGITLPFAPWSVGRTNAEVDRTDAVRAAARARYGSSRSMVLASVRDNFYRASSRKAALEAYQRKIIPDAEAVLSTSSSAYEAGSMDFVNLLDSYLRHLTIIREYFQFRLDFEKAVTGLELATGMQGATAGQ